MSHPEDDVERAGEDVGPGDDTQGASPEANPKRTPEAGVDAARRRLLRAMVYAAPIVVSTVVVKPAHAQARSCGPSACPPSGGPCGPGPYGCPPAGGPCGPGPYGCPPAN